MPTTNTPACAPRGVGRAAWVAQQKGRKATLYVVRLTGNGETFYKVGITFCFSSRFTRLSLPYALRTFARFSSYNAGQVWDLEKRLHTALAAQTYQPLLPFAGHTECFTDAAAILALLPKQTFILKHVTQDGTANSN
ncbi:GIY-YIG nuclease family protein [Hymenobacter fodinae]|uniref:GIY-YIG nuclease family protein n=1 Tax=Hymenobacter fodinae TaxID=2510796 RepID=A0A4Z0P5Q2_9BACT|nr:GIY-YIG nuclease family protein [Hymenobacter fodinae]TGE07714.1 hypothetical protein EU556_08140 [Hymenobacter fodinae]